MTAVQRAGRRRSRRLRWLLGAFCILAVYLVADTVLPIHRYRAYCPGSDTTIDGPYRERFLWAAGEALRREGWYFVIYEGSIYLSGLPARGREPQLFRGLFDYQINTDWKIASAIADNVEIDNTVFAPPARLVQMLRETEAKYGPFPKRTEKGERIYGPDYRFYQDCELMKAAILPDEAFGAVR